MHRAFKSMTPTKILNSIAIYKTVAKIVVLCNVGIELMIFLYSNRIYMAQNMRDELTVEQV